ncbi:large ribosomal subunit protein eL21-like [Glossophaga mutica]
MSKTTGMRRSTCYMFSRPFRKLGVVPLATYMRIYKKGDTVDRHQGNEHCSKRNGHSSSHSKAEQVYSVHRWKRTNGEAHCVRTNGQESELLEPIPYEFMA